MPIPDAETPVTYFANPYLRCLATGCNQRAVGVIGSVRLVGTVLELPVGARNWPCYHAAGRTSVCSNWTSTTGCQHGIVERAAHSNVLAFEGTRK